MDPNSVDMVIYHGNCSDGFGAAFSAWKLLGSRAEYIPGKFGTPPPDVTGKKVVVLDFSYDNPTIKEMIEKTEDAASAWVEYFWPRPGSGESVKKLAYVRRISVNDEMMIIGAGLYELEK